MVKALPGATGVLSLDDARLPRGPQYRIPMYGVADQVLGKDANWTTNFGPGAITSMQWNGSPPFQVDFNFTLVAGVHCRTREVLFQHVLTMNAMVTHVNGAGNLAEPPPRVHLIWGKHINGYGILRNVSCNGSAPWSTVSGGLPTSVVFSGTFMSAPGYDGKLIDVKTNIIQDARHVLTKGYV